MPLLSEKLGATSAPLLFDPLRVLIVDDHLAVREGLSRLIGNDPVRPRPVFTASSTAEALRALVDVRPHVVVLDVDLAGADGLALLPALVAVAQVLVLSCHGDRETRRRAFFLGARAFIEKGEPASVLLEHLSRCEADRFA